MPLLRLSDVDQASPVRPQAAPHNPLCESSRPMMAIFSLAIVLNAALLFLVQPMIAKMILPWLGGSPAVWNTSLVFYQTCLLAGYGYAHFGSYWLGTRRQALAHLIL